MIDGELRVLRVVEGRACPRRRGMAGRARGREELRLGRVAWIRGVVVIRLVTSHASRRQRRVIAVDVAEGAGRRGMRARQRECRVVVVEGGVGPHGRVVAQIALLRESRGHVVRIRRAVVIGQVAGHARRAVQGIRAGTFMTIGASPRRDSMRTRQRESRAGVVKGSVCPEHGIVTGFAGRWEVRGNVIYRRGRGVVVVQVARYAGRVRNVVVVVDMAVGTSARRHRMSSGQCKPGGVVIEGRIQP